MSRKIYIIIAMVFTVVLSVSTFFIIRNHIDSAKQNEVYDNLAEIVQDEPPKENEGVTFSEDKDYLAEYLELYLSAAPRLRKFPLRYGSDSLRAP